MAVNLASKYSQKVDERFKLRSLTESAVNREYEFTGVNAVTVYSIPTVAMGDYTKSGLTRYGTAAELDNTVQTLTLSRDRAFTFTIDRGNYQDTQMVMQAGKALARQIDEIYVPEVDIYRLSTMSAAAIAAGGTATAAVTASNAYSVFLDACSYLADNKVPNDKRIAFITPAFYKFIKLDPSFVKNSDLGQKIAINGQVGEVDGVKIVLAPSSYFPANHAFIIAHPSATVSATKLEDYKTHDNPVGVNGWVVEGRCRYGAWVLNNKNKALYAHKTV